MREISVSDLRDLIDKHDDVLIVDVREREPFARGHIADALVVPAGALEHATDSTSIACNERLVAARGSTVVLCCDDGRRSRVAADMLDRLGFAAVYLLTGGLIRWQNEGLPLVRD